MGLSDMRLGLEMIATCDIFSFLKFDMRLGQN